MGDYKSNLRVWGPIMDGDLYDSEMRLMPIAGQNGTTNYQALAVDSDGRLHTYLFDGSIDLILGVDGADSPTNDSGIMMLGEDTAGKAQYIRTDTDGKVFVIIDNEAHSTDLFTYDDLNLVKNTPLVVTTYTPTVSTAYVTGFLISGSGYLKAEVQWGPTDSEVTKIVLFNSPACPNIIYNFPDKSTPNIATTQTILIRCTNLEHASSPASDFDGYATILSYQVS